MKPLNLRPTRWDEKICWVCDCGCVGAWRIEMEWKIHLLWILIKLLNWIRLIFIHSLVRSFIRSLIWCVRGSDVMTSGRIHIIINGWINVFMNLPYIRLHYSRVGYEMTWIWLWYDNNVMEWSVWNHIHRENFYRHRCILLLIRFIKWFSKILLI